MSAENVVRRFVASQEKTFTGKDIARMHDDLSNYWKATVKGIDFEVKCVEQKGQKYDIYEFYVDGKKVWSTKARGIDGANIAGGSFEAFVLDALEKKGITRAPY